MRALRTCGLADTTSCCRLIGGCPQTDIAMYFVPAGSTQCTHSSGLMITYDGLVMVCRVVLDGKNRVTGLVGGRVGILWGGGGDWAFETSIISWFLWPQFIFTRSRLDRLFVYTTSRHTYWVLFFLYFFLLPPPTNFRYTVIYSNIPPHPVGGVIIAIFVSERVS